MYTIKDRRLGRLSSRGRQEIMVIINPTKPLYDNTKLACSREFGCVYIANHEQLQIIDDFKLSTH